MLREQWGNFLFVCFLEGERRISHVCTFQCAFGRWPPLLPPQCLSSFLSPGVVVCMYHTYNNVLLSCESNVGVDTIHVNTWH